VDGRDAPGGAGHAATARPAAGALLSLWASAKREVGGDAVASAWPWGDAVRGPLVSVRVAARGRWRSVGLVAGPQLGQKWCLVEEVGGPLSVEVVFLSLYLIQI
jgi:hypothetical protein